MGMARFVVDAVLLEGRSAREVATAHELTLDPSRTYQPLAPA